MIQLSFLLGPEATAWSVAAPLELTPVGDGLRLSGVWPHDDLAAARRQLLSALAALPAELEVTCLFTGRHQALSTWRAEWSAPPTLANTFEARHAIVEGRLFARLFGAYQIGESDIVLVAEEATDVTEVYELLSSWARFRIERRREPPRWEHPFPYGFGLLGFAEHDVGDAEFWALLRDSLQSHHLKLAFSERMEAPGPRVLIESEDSANPDAPYAIGATRTIALRARQRQTIARLTAFYADGDPAWSKSLTQVVSPNAQDAAGACERFIDQPGRDCFAYRESPKGSLDSGWRFGCLDPDHVHDDTTLRILPLGQAVGRAPALTDYLALPPGWAVSLEEGRAWTTPPGEGRSFPDEPEADGTAP